MYRPSSSAKAASIVPRLHWIQHARADRTRQIADVFKHVLSVVNRAVSIQNHIADRGIRLQELGRDVDGTVDDAEDVLEDIRDLPGTIRARMLNPM